MGWAARLSPEAKAAARAGEFRRLARFIEDDDQLRNFLRRFPNQQLREAVRNLVVPHLKFTPKERKPRTARVIVPEEQRYA